jgi:hypothetical protein
VRTIDQQSSGKTSEVDLDEIERDWGLTYKGWHEDLGGVDLPYLTGGGAPTNPHGVKPGDVVLVTAQGSLNGRDGPAGDVVDSKPYGSSFTVAEVSDGWAEEEA